MPFSVIVQERLQSNICVKVDRTLGGLLPGTKGSFISFQLQNSSVQAAGLNCV